MNSDGYGMCMDLIYIYIYISLVFRELLANISKVNAFRYTLDSTVARGVWF